MHMTKNDRRCVHFLSAVRYLTLYDYLRRL